MPRKIIYPYKIGSASARLLANSIGGLRVRAEGRYRPHLDDFIINWGNSTIPAWWNRFDDSIKLLNYPHNVGNASNKLRTFEILQEAGVAIPSFTTDRLEAETWDDGDVYERHVLRGHSGAGIRVVGPGERILQEPLYVRGVQNNGEYRVHVVNGEVIDYQKKRRRNEDPATEEQLQIRNLANGWIYTRENLRRLDRIEELAVAAVEALGLDFGAVDIIKDENGAVFVLEVNTACGMSETTLSRYTEAFNNLFNNA